MSDQMTVVAHLNQAQQSGAVDAAWYVPDVTWLMDELLRLRQEYSTLAHQHELMREDAKQALLKTNARYERLAQSIEPNYDIRATLSDDQLCARLK